MRLTARGARLGVAGRDVVREGTGAETLLVDLPRSLGNLRELSEIADWLDTVRFFTRRLSGGRPSSFARWVSPIPENIPLTSSENDARAFCGVVIGGFSSLSKASLAG